MIPTEQSTLFQLDSETSQDAADRAPTGLREVVYRAIRAAADHGATEEELSAELGMEGSTTRPRIVELLDDGRIVRSNRKRPTSSGRWAYVYVDAAMLHVADRLLLTGIMPR